MHEYLLPGEMFMYRKITSFLETWKESEYRKPLILQGARQVGKTYSILEFGRTQHLRKISVPIILSQFYLILPVKLL